MCVLSNNSRLHSLCILMYVLGLIVLICFSYFAVSASKHISNFIRTYYPSCTSTEYSPKGQVTEHIHKPKAMMLQPAPILSSAHHMQHKCSDNTTSRAGEYISFFKIDLIIFRQLFFCLIRVRMT